MPIDTATVVWMIVLTLDYEIANHRQYQGKGTSEEGHRTENSQVKDVISLVGSKPDCAMIASLCWFHGPDKL